MFKVGQVYSTLSGVKVKLLDFSDNVFTGQFSAMYGPGKFGKWDAQGRWLTFPNGVHDLIQQSEEVESADKSA